MTKDALTHKAGGGYLESLDFLRAIAILLVFFFHIQIDLVQGFRFATADYGDFFLKEGIAWSRILWNVLPSAFGASGVELFLLISGFLIHLAYLRSKSTLKLGAFYSKRFWRIYPPYIISIILLYPISTNAGGRDLLLHALLLHNLSEVSFFSMNPSYWSLALEAQLYLVYPLLLLFREKWGFKQTLIMLCVLSILASIQQYVYAPSSAVLDKSLLKFWVFWAFGAFLAEYHVHGQRFFRVHGVWLFGVGLLIVLSKFTTLHQPLKFYLYTLFHAVLLERFLTIRISVVRGWSTRIVKGSVLLGLASYSFYLFHQPMIRWVIGWDLFGNTGLGVVSFVLVTFTLVMMVSWLSYGRVEIPSIAVGRRLRGLRKS